jgi:hypothetical protein
MRAADSHGEIVEAHVPELGAAAEEAVEVDRGVGVLGEDALAECLAGGVGGELGNGIGAGFDRDEIVEVVGGELANNLVGGGVVRGRQGGLYSSPDFVPGLASVGSLARTTAM